MASLHDARSFLFVPGNRPDRYEKAARSGADAIVLDLEDAVPLAEKAAARQQVAAAMPVLALTGTPVVVRINATSQREGMLDLQWLASVAGLTGIMVAKAERREDVAAVAAASPGVPLLPLIESAAGLDALGEIASGPSVARLVVGHLDFMADTGMHCSRDERELTPLRFAVAMATRRSGLAPAVDGVTVAIHDEALLKDDVLRMLRFGFGGKLCIHPRQVETVHEHLAPAAEEVAWARRVLEADANHGGAAVQVDGRMVDAPVVAQARRLLLRAR